MTAGLGAILLSAHAQLKRFYSLDNVSSFDTVEFSLHATSGTSFFRNVQGGNPLNIFGNPDLDKINPSFNGQLDGRTYIVDLQLDEYKSSSLGDGLVYAMFSNKEEEEGNYWKILLNDLKVYRLNLDYGIGSSDIDLSGTAVENLMLKTGSADITVNYQKDQPNRIEMDTFMVKVDLGSFSGNDLYYSRAKNLIAEIGFGQAKLDFSKAMESTCNVKASVGAGKLIIILPKDEPVIIKIKDSPLCGISMVKNFEEVENNVFVNMAYNARARNLLKFDIDLALGNVYFEYEKD